MVQENALSCILRPRGHLRAPRAKTDEANNSDFDTFWEVMPAFACSVRAIRRERRKCTPIDSPDQGDHSMLFDFLIAIPAQKAASLGLLEV